MDELECMRNIDTNLQAVLDEAARSRIAGWIAAKYLGSVPPVGQVTHGSLSADSESYEAGRRDQIPGIAKLSPSGELQLTVRDFKAKSANEAAVRLVHVTIWAWSKLTGEGSVSSKSVIVPLLKKYRCYDGNTRGVIAKDKGLVRDGDQLSLDFHAEQFALKVVKEICDPAVEGSWKPGGSKRRVLRASREAGSGAL